MNAISDALGSSGSKGLHEVWLELSSGTRALVGSNLPDAKAASMVANRWIRLTRDQPEDWHETHPGSGALVRGSSVIAIRAQAQPPTPSRLRGPREGVWL